MAGEIILKAERLAVGYAERPVLDDVNLEIRAGEFWFLLGQNGAGKTSFLLTLLGLLPPLAGSLWRDPVRARRERVGFVPQRCELNPNLPTTVREFVMLGLVGVRATAAERRERLRAALAATGLAGLETAPHGYLSEGMRQRTLVARALVRRPTLIVLDEPTSNLDPASSERLLDLLLRLNVERGLTIVLVTHDVGVVGRHASHVALLHAGRVLAGERADVFRAENLRAAYGYEIVMAETGEGRMPRPLAPASPGGVP